MLRNHKLYNYGSIIIINYVVIMNYIVNEVIVI